MIDFILETFGILLLCLFSYLVIGYTEMTVLAFRKHKEKFILIAGIYALVSFGFYKYIQVLDSSNLALLLGILAGTLWYSVKPFNIKKIVKWIHRKK